MNDYIKSSVGGEATDQSFVAQNVKPVWHLTPLPLEQVQRRFPHRAHLRSSLTSLCLQKISHSFHLFTPTSLSTLPPTLLSRILSRVLSDRGYDLDDLHPALRPDIATIWAYGAMLDPENGFYPDHTLALPTSTTLLHLAPNPDLPEPHHPFNAIPGMYRVLQPNAPLELLTTLSLDGLDGIVNDQNILNLKWCTHLTVLVMRGCKVTDVGLRLLASSLDLSTNSGKRDTGDSGASGDGGRRGMWKLRAWFLTGCKGVTDSAMRSLARWPGLALLDVRDTSCTTSAMGIFNRNSRQYFSGHNADFQECTTGLEPLFSSRSTPAEILESLCLTIIQRPQQIPEPGSGGRWWLSLNIVPALQPLDASWLPNHSSGSVSRTQSQGLSQTRKQSTVYRPGLGQVYGSKVSSISDEAMLYKTNLRTAMRIQAEDEGLCDREKASWEIEKEWRKKGRGRYKWDDSGPTKKVLKGFKLKDDDIIDMSRSFYTGGSGSGSRGRGGRGARGRKGFLSNGVRVDDSGETEAVKGDRSCMMVRMVCDHWESLTWGTPAPIAMGDTPMAMAISSSQAIRRSTQRADDLIGDILGTSQRQQYHDRSSPPRIPLELSMPSSPMDFKPVIEDVKPIIQFDHVDVKPDIINPFASKPKLSSNPFKQVSRPATTPMGVRPLTGTRSTSSANKDLLAGIKSAATFDKYAVTLHDVHVKDEAVRAKEVAMTAKKAAVKLEKEAVSIKKELVASSQTSPKPPPQGKQGNILAFFGSQSKKRSSEEISAGAAKRKIM